MFSKFCFPIAAALLISLASCSHHITDIPYSEALTPPPPDYSNTDMWAALPDRKDKADLVPTKKFSNQQADAKVDVFFVHPTTFGDSEQWNASVLDKELNKQTDNMPIRHQASVFNGSCKVYAPRYRQAHVRAFYQQENGGREALAIAYSDVRAAFQYYLDHYNNGRPVIIASHSQGTTHAIRLMQDFFDGKPLADKLVAAYLVGMPIKHEYFESLEPCHQPAKTECYVGWLTYEEGYAPPDVLAFCEGAVCVNPVSWLTDTVFVAQDKHKGFATRGFNRVRKHVVGTRVHKGMLWITKPDVPFKFLLFRKSYHIADYNLFWVDIRTNVATRVDTYLKEQTTKKGQSAQ